MASQNDQVYYEDDEQHGSYQYVPLEDLVNNFIQNYTGDSTVLGVVKRSNVVSWMKKGLKQLTFNALNEVRAVELELGDLLDITMPPDYVSLVRLSWLNTDTGEFYPMAENTRTNTTATAYLQDHEAKILFDDDGIVLEGTSATESINNANVRGYRLACPDENGQIWNLDTGKNYNGSFNINKREGRIHFSSDCATRIIILEYISDSLQYSADADLKIHKFAEMALYNWTKWNLLANRINVSEYKIKMAKDEYFAEKRNATIRLMGIRIAETTQQLKQRARWVRT